jgi:hypothetical protein
MRLAPDIMHLVRRINAREDSIQEKRTDTVARINGMLCEVLLQGQDLILLKARVQYGTFENTVTLHCPKVGLRQAQRYMLLASKAPDLDGLDETKSLRQALALCDTPVEQDKKPKKWPPFLEAVSKLSKLCGYVKTNPIANWPDDGRAKFRSELEPIARELWPERFNTTEPTAHNNTSHSTAL